MNKVTIVVHTQAEELQKLVDKAVDELGDSWEIVFATTHAEHYEIDGAPTSQGNGPYAILATTIVAKKL